VERTTLDPNELLEQLRAEHEVLRWAPLSPQVTQDPDSGGDSHEDRKAHNRSALDYLHHNWALADTFEPSARDSGLRGSLVALFGRLTYKVLTPYFAEERALLSHAVQVIDDLEERCSALTLRLQQLSNDVTDRQVAEAENQAKLALWLHLAPPASTRSAGYTAESTDEGSSSSSS
jgi:hypothetical protein